jgi:exodeoxyribonuclease V alpha subunit
MARTASQTSEDSEVLAGLVERVVFHSPETGFCVLKVEARGRREPVTIVGHAPLISAGEFVQASGSWANDRTHGLQFRASFLKATAPTTPAAIEKYLGSRMIRGIGPVYAKKLVAAFGDSVFDVIENNPGSLRRVPASAPSAPGRSRRIGRRSARSARSCCSCTNMASAPRAPSASTSFTAPTRYG